MEPPIALTPDGNFVYVGWDDGSGNIIQVIRALTLEVEATISFSVGGLLSNVVFTPDGQFAYVSAENSFETYVIDTAAHSVVATLPVFGFALLMAPDGSWVFIAANAVNANIISLPANSVIATLSDLNKGAATSDSLAIYARISNGSNAFKIDAATGMILQTIPVGASIGSLETSTVITPDDQYVYVSNTDGTVSVIDASVMPNSVIATLDIGGVAPAPIASADSAFVYFPIDSGTVVVDVAAQTAIITIPTGNTFTALLSPDGLSLFAFNGNTAEIDTATNSIVRTFLTGNGSVGGAYWVGSFPAPSDILPSGQQLSNRFLSQSDLINVINWQAPIGFTPALYKIYRDAALTQLAGEVDGSQLRFKDHNRKKKQFYSYYIVAVNGAGETLTLGSVTVTPIL